jgi:hypothetical protein
MSSIKTLKTVTINMVEHNGEYIFDVKQDDIDSLTPQMVTALQSKLGGDADNLIAATRARGISYQDKKSPFDVMVNDATYIVYIMNISNWRFFGGGPRNEPMAAKMSNDHSWEVWQNNFSDVDILASDEKGMLAIGITDTCANSSPDPYECYFTFDIFARVYQNGVYTDIVIDPGIGNGGHG